MSVLVSDLQIGNTYYKVGISLKDPTGNPDGPEGLAISTWVYLGVISGDEHNFVDWWRLFLFNFNRTKMGKHDLKRPSVGHKASVNDQGEKVIENVIASDELQEAIRIHLEVL